MPWLVARLCRCRRSRRDGATVVDCDAGARRYLAAVAEEAGDSLLRELDAETQRRADHGARSVDHVAGKIGVLGNENAGAAQSPDRAAVDDASGKIADVQDGDGAEAAGDKHAVVGDTAGKAKLAENVDGRELRADDPAGAVDDAAGECPATARPGWLDPNEIVPNAEIVPPLVMPPENSVTPKTSMPRLIGRQSSLLMMPPGKTQRLRIDGGEIRPDDGAGVVDDTARRKLAFFWPRSEYRFD